MRKSVFGIHTGDFVLRGVLPRHQHTKLAFRWVSPYRIVQVLTEFIFILQHLVTGDKCEVHGSRVLYFRNSDYDVTKDVIEHLEYQTGELHTVSEFVVVRVWQGSIVVRARWRGHEAWEDTRESVKAMREDVPVLLQSYLDATRSSASAKQKSILVQHHL
jgi:oligoribonuclease (3'-5' exoribonuclease)